MEERKIYKFCFEAQVRTLKLSLRFPCVVGIFWKRGEKISQIPQRKQIENGVAKIDQKLQLECNMMINLKTQCFEEKKTKITVVIYSDKGTKQAGEIHLDVSELLNSKSKKLNYCRYLQNCPDKKAVLQFDVTGYMKEEKSFDSISQASIKTGNMNSILNENSNMPNFKKKKQGSTSAIGQEKKEEDRKKSSRTLLPVSKQNMSKVQFEVLQKENKKLQQKLQQLHIYEQENQRLKKHLQNQEKKAKEQYKNKFEKMNQEYSDLKTKLEQLKTMKLNKRELQVDLAESKNKMAAIVNYAITHNIPNLAEQIYNIYQEQT